MIITNEMRSGRVPDPADRINSGVQIDHTKEALCLKPSPEKKVAVKCPKELFARIRRPVLDEIKPPAWEYNDETETLNFLGMNQEVIRRLSEASGGDKALIETAQVAYKKALEKCESDISTARARSDAEQESARRHAEIMADVQSQLIEIRKHQAEEQKGKPKRGYTEGDAESYKNLAPEAQEASKKRLLDSKVAIKKKGSKAGTEIEKLQKQMEPHAEKINVLKTQLDNDLNESEYKDIRLSIEFQEMKLARITSKISPHEKEQADLNGQVKEIDKKIEILNCAIDGSVAFPKELHNFKRKQDRLRTRVDNFLRDREAMVMLHGNLNKKWRELTGDREDICPPLTLRADDKMYLI